jgi:hypothetical protein
MADDESTYAAADVFAHFERGRETSEQASQLWKWALTLLCWDGVLPVVVISFPNLLKHLFPNWAVGLAMAAVFAPVLALGARFVIGWIRMRQGHARIWQLVLFTIAISSLFFFEAFLLNDQVGDGPKIGDPTVLLIMFLVYLTMMAFALFPLRNHTSDPPAQFEASR